MELLYAAHVPSGDGPFPTVLLLHGWGANAHDLLGLAPMIHDGRALVLCPQGPIALPIGGGNYGYGWFPLNPGAPGAPVDVAAYERGANALRAFVDGALARYPIDPQRIVPMGFSQGGVMAYDLALREPERYSGIAALSSWLPGLLAEDLPRTPAQEGFPVLVVHGTQDPMLGVEKARESRELLRPFGVAITYREFDMGHEIRPEALRVVLKWLSEKAFSDRTR
jgi:phospholipase/carboxylesterase